MTEGLHQRFTWPMRGLAAMLLLLCLSPVVAAVLPLLRTPAESITEALTLLNSTRLWGLWLKSCAIAVGTVGVALFLGAPLGYCLHILAGARRTFLPALLSAPLFLPPHVMAVAWIDVLGPHGLVATWGIPLPAIYTPMGVALVQALSWYPIPLFVVWLHLRQQDPRIADAAKTLAPGPFVFWHVTVPLLRPALLTGALIVFLLSLLNFSVPSLLQVPVYTVEIFSSFNSLLDQRQAVLLAIPLVATGLLLGILLFRFAPRIVQQAIQSPRATPRTRDTARRYATAVSALLLGLPAAALLFRIETPHALWGAWWTGAHEIGASLLLSSVGATLLLLLTLPLALQTRRRHPVLLTSLAIAYLVSGPVLGVGLIACWNHGGVPGYLYDRFPILLVATTSRYAFFSWLGVLLVVRWLPNEIPEAAQCFGATPGQVFWRVTFPLIRRPLLALWTGLFLLLMGELECIVLIAPPGWVPVSLRIYTLMHYGPTAMVSALALLQGLASLLLLGGLSQLFSRNRVYTPGESRYHSYS